VKAREDENGARGSTQLLGEDTKANLS